MGKKIIHIINEFFEVDNLKNLILFKKYFLHLGILFFIYGILNLLFGLPLFLSILKFIVGVLFIGYWIQKKYINVILEIFILIIALIEIYLHSLFTYHLLESTLVWLIITPSFILLLKNNKAKITTIIVVILMIISTPFLNNILFSDKVAMEINPYYVNYYRIFTYLSIFIYNYLFINNYRKSYIIHFSNLSDKNAELEKIKSELTTSNQYKENFIAMVSHEIRTPLNAILGISNVLQEQLNSEPTLNESLINSSDALLSVVDDFIEFSDLSSRNIKLNNTPFELSAVVEKFCSSFENQIQEKNLHFNVNIHPNVPKFLFGDKKRFSQILHNIVGNSIKFTDKGYVTLEILNSFESEKEVDLLLIINDTGIGFDYENINDVFKQNVIKKSNEKFNHNFRASLGLNLTKKIIEAKKGNISILSQKGKGSTVSISLKYQKSDDGKSTNYNEFSFEKKNVNILLVDDNTINLAIARKQILIKNPDSIITEALNGKEAVEICEKEKFDVILMDIRMPVMDGFEASKLIINQSKLNQKTPIIALTADVTDKTTQDCKQIGIQLLITKPFELKNLIQEINKLL